MPTSSAIPLSPRISPTPQTGKVTHRTKSGQVKQVDFLSGVAGLTTKDLARRAIEMEVPDIGHLRVIHPLDVLDSRIQNLHLLPEKRTEAGIAQAHLAVGVARVHRTSSRETSAFRPRR